MGIAAEYGRAIFTASQNFGKSPQIELSFANVSTVTVMAFGSENGQDIGFK